MRDSNRIDPVLNQIRDLWKKNPDLRLGQLICNVVQDPCLYYIEDKDLISTLQTYYNKIAKTNFKNNNATNKNKNNNGKR